MAITTVSSEARSFSLGSRKMQRIQISAVSGATSGTITATELRVLQSIICPSAMKLTAAKTYSGNVATLAFTVPTETAATRTIDGILYTAVANLGKSGNSVTIRLIDGTGDTPAVTKGTETVAVTASAIVVHIDPTAITGSARNDVKAAILASAAASALAVPSTVTSGTTVAAVTSATALTGGISGGVTGVDCIAIGY